MPTQEKNPLKAAAGRVAYQNLLRLRVAFNQENAVDLLSQLKKVLPEETWDELKAKGVPKIVNDAWMGMTKKERRSRR